MLSSLPYISGLLLSYRVALHLLFYATRQQWPEDTTLGKALKVSCCMLSGLLPCTCQQCQRVLLLRSAEYTVLHSAAQLKQVC